MKQLNRLTYLFTLLVIGFTPLDAIEIGDNVTLGRYFFILMTLCAVLSRDIVLTRVPKFFKILVAFSIWAVFTTIWSINLDTTLTRVMYLAQYSIIVIVMLNVLDRPSRVKMAMLAWILGASYIAYKTASDFGAFNHSSHNLYRVYEFGNPNENSFMLCYALVFCFLIDRSRYRIPSFALIAFSVYAIVANGSRMGVILFILGVGSFCLQLWQNKKRIYVIVMIPLIIAGGAYVLNHIPAATLMRITGIADNIEQGNLAKREDIWEAARMALGANPKWMLIGSGWGTFGEAIARYLGYPIGAHNFYLDVVFTTGIVGLSIVGYYLFSLYRLIRITYKSTIMNYLLLLLPMISMLSTNWQSRRWWFLMGAFIFLIYKYHNFLELKRVRQS